MRVPCRRPAQLMSGGELHAQALEALLAERRIGTVAAPLAIALAAVLACCWRPRWRA